MADTSTAGGDGYEDEYRLLMLRGGEMDGRHINSRR